MALSNKQLNKAFLSLAKQPETSAAVCLAAAKGIFHGNTLLREICTKAGLSQNSPHRVERVLISGEEVGVFHRDSELYWSTVEGVDYQTLFHYLKGASLYREHIFKPDNLVDVVLTKPPSPSKLERVIDAIGYKAVFLENTEEIFTDLASRANQRFLIMTPFVDNKGGAKLVELFSKVPHGSIKQLIIRSQAGAPSPTLMNIQESLKKLDVQFFNYWISKDHPGTYETFHAKVVLSDSNRCYVGSANMTQSSFEYSMEMGFLVEGEAANKVSWMCDAIMKISTDFK